MNIHQPDMQGFSNAFVEGMTNHHHLQHNNEGTFELEAPVAAGTVDLMATVAMASGDKLALSMDTGVGFGRTVQIVSTNAGDVRLTGLDFLNQIVTEVVTATAGTVESVKSFKKVTSLESIDVDGDVSVGTGPSFGLPFVVEALLRLYKDNVLQTTVGTVTDADSTNPATEVTGDPRGLWTPNASNAANGVRNLQVKMKFNAETGLYGVRSI